MYLNRRRFLFALAGAVAPSVQLRHISGRNEASVVLTPPPADYKAEAERLTALVYRTFWNEQARMFRAPVRSAETVDSDPLHNNGYTFWPSILALHALVEGEKV